MDSQWLKVQFDLNPGKTKADLARALKLEPPAISKILSGNRQIKASEYMTMRRFFGLPVDGEGATSTEKHQTLTPLEGMEDQEHSSDWVIPEGIIEKRTNSPPEKIKTFQVSESLMEPDFHHGEHVLVDLMDKHPSPAGTFVVSDGFGYMLRFCEFVPNSTPPKIRISARNESFAVQILEFEGFHIVGRVIAKLQWL